VGQPLRGGIDVGIGVEFDRGDLYGPVLVSAYELESKVAQWPRIAVGKGLVPYLRWLSSGGYGGELSRGEARLADQMLAMVGPDVDGQVVLDYLGKTFRAHVNIDRALIAKAFAFVNSEYERFVGSGDEKLASRYRQLGEYFEKRRYLWA
jgi:hypothetical protein